MTEVHMLALGATWALSLILAYKIGKTRAPGHLESFEAGYACAVDRDVSSR